MWEKYWVFQGLQKLGKFDKEKLVFSKRNQHKDCSKIYNCKEDEIGFTKTDLNNPNLKVFVGELDLNSLTTAEGLKLPVDFPLENLKCSDFIRQEIMSDPDKYYGSTTGNIDLQTNNLESKNRNKNR